MDEAQHAHTNDHVFNACRLGAAQEHTLQLDCHFMSGSSTLQLGLAACGSIAV